MANETPCDRIRAARERLGLTPEEVASTIGLSALWYYHLEADPDEVFSNLSLRHLQRLGQALGLEPTNILVDNAKPPTQRIEFRDVVVRLQRRMELEGFDAETLGKHLGWQIGGALADPEELWHFNVAGLRDVCQGVGVDWLAVLPRLE